MTTDGALSVPGRSRPCLRVVDFPARPRRGKQCAKPSTEAHKALARRYYDEVLAGRRLALLNALMAPGFVGHDPMGARMDREEYIDAVAMWHDGFRRLQV